jgi:tryptophan synthase alpha chain
MNEELVQFLQRCRGATTLPLALGFGVSTREDIEFIGQHADIAIIGTAALRAWEEGGEPAFRAFFQRVLHSA